MLELSDIHTVSLVIGFSLGLVFGVISTMGYYKNEIRKSDVFAVIVSLSWLLAIFLKIETPYMLDVVGAAAAVHIIGEKSITVLVELILKHKTGK